MANRDRKTEHAGAKKGQGAYWGPKRVAKSVSNNRRRRQDKAETGIDAASEPDAEPERSRRRDR